MPTTAGSDMLMVRGLRHHFGSAAEDEVAVDIPQLTLEVGRLTVIVGPSGSGKTTLLYLLSGLLRPTVGQITWDGVDIAALSEGHRDEWRRRHAGFVFQNFNLIDEMTALQNVTVAAHFAAWSDKPVRNRAEALLAGFGVPPGHRSVATYSRGEQQRVALARALLFDPPILFADEPTASLDTTNAEALTGQLVSLADAGKTVLVVSHDPVVIAAASRVVVLRHGRLVPSQPDEVAA
jgi:putative ABC transport system ATP-binding protein